MIYALLYLLISFLTLFLELTYQKMWSDMNRIKKFILFILILPALIVFFSIIMILILMSYSEVTKKEKIKFLLRDIKEIKDFFVVIIKEEIFGKGEKGKKMNEKINLRESGFIKNDEYGNYIVIDKKLIDFLTEKSMAVSVLTKLSVEYNGKIGFIESINCNKIRVRFFENRENMNNKVKTNFLISRLVNDEFLSYGYYNDILVD